MLAAAGSSLDDVLSVTVFLTTAAHFQAMNAAYRTFWPGDPPARTTVIASLVAPDALVEITMIAAPRGGERAVIHPKGWMKSPNPYSYAIRSGDAVFLSGLVPRKGRDNSAVAGDISVQTRAVMENAAELLEAAGLTFDNVVSTRVYLTDASNFAGMNEAYRQVLHQRSSGPRHRQVRPRRSGLPRGNDLHRHVFAPRSDRHTAPGHPHQSGDSCG